MIRAEALQRFLASQLGASSLSETQDRKEVIYCIWHAIGVGNFSLTIRNVLFVSNLNIIMTISSYFIPKLGA